jgi:hypothetical protein
MHNSFRILSVLTLAMIIAIVGVYDYFIIMENNLSIQIFLKISPLVIMLILIFLYFIIYRLTIYSVLVMGSLFLCLLGDVFMALYDPSILNENYIYFILSGIFFLLARILLTFLFMIKPYKRIFFIKFPIKKLIISHVISFIIFLVLGILPLIYHVSFVSISIFLYLLFGFGFLTSYAFLRIGALKDYEIEESKTSCILAFLGISLFNKADIILLITMYTSLLPKHMVLVSDNIYWLSMYLLTISIVRSSEEHVEKGLTYFPLKLTTKASSF